MLLISKKTFKLQKHFFCKMFCKSNNLPFIWANKYMLSVSNRNTIKRREICSGLTIVDFEQVNVYYKGHDWFYDIPGNCNYKVFSHLKYKNVIRSNFCFSMTFSVLFLKHSIICKFQYNRISNLYKICHLVNPRLQKWLNCTVIRENQTSYLVSSSFISKKVRTNFLHVFPYC